MGESRFSCVHSVNNATADTTEIENKTIYVEETTCSFGAGVQAGSNPRREQRSQVYVDRPDYKELGNGHRNIHQDRTNVGYIVVVSAMYSM